MIQRTLNLIGLFFIGIMLFCLTSCNEFDSFGSDLINSDWLKASGVDTFNFEAGPAPEDTIISFSEEPTLGASGFFNRVYPLGKMTDPLFGSSSAGFGTQLRFIPTRNLSFLRFPLDSIVVSLRFDTSFFYGAYQNPMKMEVFGLTEAYDIGRIYYSNHPLPIDGTLKFGETILTASKTDSLEIREDTLTRKLYPQLRIKLDTGIFMSFLRSYPDTIYYVTDSFTNVFKGLAFVCSEGNGYVSVQPEHSDSKLTLYYTDTTGRQSRTELFMGSQAVKTPYYQRDPGNSLANECYQGNISGDSLLCIQGNGGRDIQLKMPFQSAWTEKFINYAVLEFTVSELPDPELETYPLPGLLEVFDYSGGTRVAIDDVILVAGSAPVYRRAFGGYPISKEENGKISYSYRMNITRHFQKSLRSKSDLNLIISPFAKLESPARVVLNGRKSATARAKLILTYSE